MNGVPGHIGEGDLSLIKFSRNFLRSHNPHKASKIYHHEWENIVQLLLNNSGYLDLNAKSKDGRTGFQLAKIFSNFDIVELIESKMPSLAKENRKRKSMD